MPDFTPLQARTREVRGWLEERFTISRIWTFARKKEVPLHRHSVWYYVGGMTLFLFVVQVATGILLLFYYRPSAQEAFASVRFIMAEVKFGWLIRSVHAWAANLMVFSAFVHLFSVLLLKSYRKPRELTWVTGVLLMGIIMTFGFTGYLLPWNELAYFATRVGTEIIGAIPLVGSSVLRILRGSENVTGATLTRFYAIHVAVLPAITTFLVGFHLLFVQKQGMSTPASVRAGGTEPPAMPFFPNFFLRDLIGWLVVLAILTTLAAFFPFELGREADPFAPAPAGIKPEWYFMFMFQTLKYLPAHILWIFEGEAVGVVAFIVAGVAFLLVPFWDNSGTGPRARVIQRLAIAVIIYIVVLTILGYTADPTQ